MDNGIETDRDRRRTRLHGDAKSGPSNSAGSRSTRSRVNLGLTREVTALRAEVERLRSQLQLTPSSVVLHADGVAAEAHLRSAQGTSFPSYPSEFQHALQSSVSSGGLDQIV